MLLAVALVPSAKPDVLDVVVAALNRVAAERRLHGLQARVVVDDVGGRGLRVVDSEDDVASGPGLVRVLLVRQVDGVHVASLIA